MQAASRSFGECTFCMDDILMDHGRLALDCGHLFHSACVTAWIEKVKSCPVCRHPVVLTH